MSHLEQVVEEWLFLCGCSPRASGSQEADILQAAIDGIPRLAQAIAAIPAQDRATAFGAAERSYLKTANDLGGADKFAQGWASAVTLQLGAEVEQRVLENIRRLKALHEELARGDFADPQEFPEIEQRRRRIRGIRFRSHVGVIKATRELRFSILAATVPMFGLIPFPADRLPGRAVAEEKRPTAALKKGRKRIPGQGEMLLPIPGKKAKVAAASKPVARPSTGQKKAALANNSRSFSGSSSGGLGIEVGAVIGVVLFAA